MKSITFICALLITIVAHSQTADGYLQIQFLGQSGGQYKVQVKNLQNCKADIEFKFNGSASAITPDWKNNINHNEIPALSTVVYTITGTLTTIQIKALSICNWAGQSPVWLTIDQKTLPVTITAIRIRKINY